MALDGHDGGLLAKKVSFSRAVEDYRAAVFLALTWLPMTSSDLFLRPTLLALALAIAFTVHADEALISDATSTHADPDPESNGETQSSRTLEGVTVTGTYRRGGQALYLDEERYAPVVAEAIGAEQIARTGDSDAATTLKRITGLTLVDGRFVYVRGLGERYSSVTLNGAPIPSPDPTRRVVPLDLFPTDLLDGIVVQKAYTPDMPGEFGGGAVQLRTRDVPTKFFARVSGTLGYTQNTTFADGVGYNGGGSDWSGHDGGARSMPDSLAAALGGEFLREQSPLSPDGATSVQLERYGEDLAHSGFDTHTRTLGPNGGFYAALGNSFSLSDKIRFGFMGAARYSQSWEHNEEQRNAYNTSNSGLVLTDHLVVDDSRRQIDASAFFNLGLDLGRQHRLSATSLLLRQTEDRTQIFDGREDEQDARITTLRWTENQLFAQQFAGTHHFPEAHDIAVDWQYTWARATRNEPNTRRYRYDYEPDGHLLFSQRSDSNLIRFSSLDDHQRDLSVKSKLPFDFSDGSTLELQAGVEKIQRDRDAAVRSFSYRAVGSDARDPSILDGSLDEIFSPENIGPDGFVLGEATLPTDNYFAKQNLTAAFIGLDSTIAMKYRLALGMRHERNDQDVTTFSLSNPTAPPVIASEDAHDHLPAAAFTWLYSDTTQVRASYSQTLSRPDFRELSPAAFLDPVLDVFTIGNPSLRTTHLINYDLRWEYYFSPIESMSFGAFLKDFDNPIEKTRLPGSGTLLTLENAKSARNYGLEFDVSKGFDFVADWPGFRTIHGDWANWYVAMNYARIRSRIRLDPESSSFQTHLDRPMQGQSPYVTNLQIGHRAGDGSSEATLLYNLSGRRIAEVGVAGQPDIYEEPFKQLDFAYRHMLDAAWSFKLRLRNLLNPKVRYTQGSLPVRTYHRGREVLFTLEWVPAE